MDAYEGYKRVYIDVKYNEREEAKSLGCGWSPSAKSWFYNKPTLPKLRNGFLEKEEIILDKYGYEICKYFDVTDDQAKQAEKDGLKFDVDLHAWYLDTKHGLTIPKSHINVIDDQYDVYSNRVKNLISKYNKN